MPNCCPPCAEEMYGSGVDPSTLSSGTHVVNYADESDMPCSLNDNEVFSYVGVIVLPNASDYDL